MSSGRSSSKSGLFLMELIIAIAFFAVASAICIQLFAKAHMLSARSGDINSAVAAAQSAAECFKSTNAFVEEMVSLLDAEAVGDAIVVTYGDDWIKSNDIRFILTVRLDRSTPVAKADIIVVDNNDGSTLYQMTAKKYTGQSA